MRGLWTHQHELQVAGSSIDDDRDLEVQNIVDSGIDSCHGNAIRFLWSQFKLRFL
jgi:hypothetical protein